VRRKIKENNGKLKKIKSLVNKNAYEDQLVPFVNLVLEFSPFSLSLSHSSTLEFS